MKGCRNLSKLSKGGWYLSGLDSCWVEYLCSVEKITNSRTSTTYENLDFHRAGTPSLLANNKANENSLKIIVHLNQYCTAKYGEKDMHTELITAMNIGTARIVSVNKSTGLTVIQMKDKESTQRILTDKILLDNMILIPKAFDPLRKRILFCTKCQSIGHSSIHCNRPSELQCRTCGYAGHSETVGGGCPLGKKHPKNLENNYLPFCIMCHQHGHKSISRTFPLMTVAMNTLAKKLQHLRVAREDSTFPSRIFFVDLFFVTSLGHGAVQNKHPNHPAHLCTSS
jgi:hypothetical protein